MPELGLADTLGILSQPDIQPRSTSSGLGWTHLYVSSQRERAYQAEFAPAPTHLIVLHLGGPVTVRRGRGSGTRSRRIPPGGLFLQPADRELSVELAGDLDTVHAYLSDHALREANEGRPVELAEELGVSDPLAEQLMRELDSAVHRWEPSARTYVDQLTGMLAAQLVRRHVPRPATPAPSRSGLSDRQLTAVRDLMHDRIAEPLPIADLASAASLSPSQFTRQFRASTGHSPHQYLLSLRLERASQLLRTGSAPIWQVAVDCGFSHQEHLTRVMRSRLGTTPAAMRRAESRRQ
ncbi:helix-turn-helix domain-containing protein [Streptomyces fuscichromogenes]|uniref:AraC family transcriptional regulator n=1 Tax=Streptomyces fuscichromogenes TaxID=1324013 RepID=A0A917X9G3_9ACTN|nr:helix-turn-helix domain-containing protein [Streptomyces fuscichromogenes]GGM97111.1 AraC family transcriptional regulator [Streptomyces fuscichromogenes]